MGILRVRKKLLLMFAICILILPFFLVKSEVYSQDKPQELESPSRAPGPSTPAGSALSVGSQAIEVKYETGKLSVKAVTADLAALLKKVSETTGIAIEVVAGVSGTVSLSFSDLKLEEGIKRILETADAENYLAAFDKDNLGDADGFALRKIVVSRRDSGDLSSATAKGDSRPAIEVLCLNAEEKDQLRREMEEILGSISRKDEDKLVKSLERLKKIAIVDLCGGVVQEAVPVIINLLKEYPDPGTEYVKQFLKLSDERTDEYFAPTASTKARVALLRALGVIGDEKVLPYLERIRDTSPAILDWGEWSQPGEGGAALYGVILIRGRQRFLDDARKDNTEQIIQKLLFDVKYSTYESELSSKSKEYSEAAKKVYRLDSWYKVQAFARIGKPAVAPLLRTYEETIRLDEDFRQGIRNQPYPAGRARNWCLESLGKIGDPSVLEVLEKYSILPESKTGRYGSNLGKTIEILKAKRR